MIVIPLEFVTLRKNKNRVLPFNTKKRVEIIRRKVVRFVFLNDALYRRVFDGMLLRCLSKNEVVDALHETHSRTCGAYQIGPKLTVQLKMLSYY